MVHTGTRGNIIRRRQRYISLNPPRVRDFAFVHYVMPWAYPRVRRNSKKGKRTKKKREREREEKKEKIRSIRGGEWNPTVEMACFIAFPKIYCREIATFGYLYRVPVAENTGLTIIIGWLAVIRGIFAPNKISLSHGCLDRFIPIRIQSCFSKNGIRMVSRNHGNAQVIFIRGISNRLYYITL